MRCHSRSTARMYSNGTPASPTGKRAYQRPLSPRASAASSASRHGSADPSAGASGSRSTNTIRSCGLEAGDVEPRPGEQRALVVGVARQRAVRQPAVATGAERVEVGDHARQLVAVAQEHGQVRAGLAVEVRLQRAHRREPYDRASGRSSATRVPAARRAVDRQRAAGRPRALAHQQQPEVPLAGPGRRGEAAAVVVDDELEASVGAARLEHGARGAGVALGVGRAPPTARAAPRRRPAAAAPAARASRVEPHRPGRDARTARTAPRAPAAGRRARTARPCP